MDELIELVSQKTGLPADRSRTAAETVLKFLKDKLPDSIASQIDQVVQGKSPDDLGKIAKGLGGMFGK